MKFISLVFIVCGPFLASSCTAATTSHDKTIEELLTVSGLTDSLYRASQKTLKIKVSQTEIEHERLAYECFLKRMTPSSVVAYSLPVFKRFFSEKDAARIIAYSKSGIGKNSIRFFLEFKLTEEEFDAIVNKYDKNLTSTLNAQTLLHAWIQTQYEGSLAGEKLGYECLNTPDVKKLMSSDMVKRSENY